MPQQCHGRSPTAASPPSQALTRASSSTAPTTSCAPAEGGIYFSDPRRQGGLLRSQAGAGAVAPERVPRRPRPKHPTLLVDDSQAQTGCVSPRRSPALVQRTARKTSDLDVKATAGSRGGACGETTGEGRGAPTAKWKLDCAGTCIAAARRRQVFTPKRLSGRDQVRSPSATSLGRR